MTLREILRYASFIGLAVFFILFGVLSSRPSVSHSSFSPEETQRASVSSSQVISGALFASSTDPFKDLSLVGKSAFVWDIKDGRRVFARDGDTERPLASLTKLMTVLVAQETLSENTPVVIEASDLAPEGDVGLSVGSTWKVRALSDLALVASSNDAATALARAAGETLLAHDATSTSLGAEERFVQAMNDRARLLGLTATSFQNPTGLDIDTETPSARGSARDVAMLISYVAEHHPTFFSGATQSAERVRGEDGTRILAENTNDRAQRMVGLIASKTGFTDLAGGNLAIVMDVGVSHPVAIVILGSTKEARTRDVSVLSLATIDALSR